MRTDFCLLSVSNMESTVFVLLLVKFTVIFQELFLIPRVNFIRLCDAVVLILFCLWDLQLSFAWCIVSTSVL